jgi:hypothetical protein
MPDPPQLPDLSPDVLELLALVNDEPVVLSALYDLDMLPEQIDRDTTLWKHLLRLLSAFRDLRAKYQFLTHE